MIDRKNELNNELNRKILALKDAIKKEIKTLKKSDNFENIVNDYGAHKTNEGVIIALTRVVKDLEELLKK